MSQTVPAARLVVRVGPADVGRRVTLRRRLAGRGQTLGDVVGVLESWSGGDDGVLTVRRRDDSRERVAARDLVAARVVAPEVSATELQRVAQAGWPPAETARLGDWELRWAGGVSGRANSVRVGGEPDRPLRAALEAVTAWYAARDGVPQLQLASPSTWDAALDALGWHEARRTLVLTASTPHLLVSSTRAVAGLTTQVLPQPSEAWLEMLPDHDPETDARLRAILTGPTRVGFAEVRREGSGELVGIGRASVYEGWTGVTSVEVAPTLRRHGVATVVMHALAAWGAEQGAGRVYLQVFESNTGARALYDRLGLTAHHAYVYRRPAA